MKHSEVSRHVLSLLVSAALVSGSKVRNVYWNTTTASFSDKPMIVTVNEGNLPWEYDQLNLICPVARAGAGGEEHVIYSVAREEFEACRVRGPRPRIVAVCNRPERFMYFTITFRSFTPTPGGLEFRPGQEYYFISTANKRDIHRRVGGWCSSHNMKMIVKVADDANISDNIIEDSTTLKPRPIPTPAAFWSDYWRSGKVPSAGERYSHEAIPTNQRQASQRSRDHSQPMSGHEAIYRDRSRSWGVNVSELRSSAVLTSHSLTLSLMLAALARLL